MTMKLASRHRHTTPGAQLQSSHYYLDHTWTTTTLYTHTDQCHQSPNQHSVAEWLACWTQAQKGPGSNRSRDAGG